MWPTQASSRGRGLPSSSTQIIAPGVLSFDTKAAAERWETAEKAKLLDGYQPALGRVTVAEYSSTWLDWRANRVQPKTLKADTQTVARLPTWLTKIEIRAVTPRHVERWQDILQADGLARSSVVRHRQVLSAMFARAVDEGRLVSNPVARASTPAGLAEPEEIHPFTPDEVRALADDIAAHDFYLAEVVLILFWTGLRWGEARALTVADYARGDAPVLRVRRSQPEGSAVKVTKSGKGRAVPLYEEAIPLLEGATYGKQPSDLLLTTSRAAQLHRTAFTRSTAWREHAQGRRIHDLRHSAICWWLSSGLPLRVVKAMAGHASISTTERYLHFVGDAATRGVLATLNAAGRTSGEPGNRAPMTDN